MTSTIHVGDMPEPAQCYGRLFDGHRPVARPARIMVDDSGPEPELIIAAPGAHADYWPFSTLRSLPDQAKRDELIVTSTTAPLRRLVLQDAPMIAALRARCKQLRKRPVVKGKGRLVLWAIGALASVALIITVLVPRMADQLAEFLPVRGEQALGDTTFEQIRDALSESRFVPLEICTNPQGLAALDKIKERLTSTLDLPYPVRVSVLDSDMVNAFALPGGHVVFFRGLIDKAQSGDEVASVFAHELGHVVHRDPTRIALRSAGSIGVLGLLLGDFAGGAVVLLLAERIIQASYTREAEAAADVFAHRLLASSGIPPSRLVSLFGRMQAEGGDPSGLVKHFATHPDMTDRIAVARAADAQMTGALRPALDDVDWHALRSICG